MPSSLKRILHIIGSGIALLGVGFVGFRLFEYSDEFQFSNYGAELSWLLVFAAITYSIANLLLGTAWWNILRMLGVVSKWLWAQKVYGLSQLAKYVPGNVFHFAGRQALGMAAGVPGKPMIKSSVWEFALLSVSGALFFFLVLPRFFEYIPSCLVLVFGVLSLLGVVILAQLKFNNYLALALISHVVFLICSGLIFVLIAAFLHDNPQENKSSWVIFLGSYVIAWLVGLVTPGAPAGVGVRELVLLFLLEGFMSESDLFLALFLARLVTVSGDILYFLFSLLISPSVTNHSPSQ